MTSAVDTRMTTENVQRATENAENVYDQMTTVDTHKIIANAQMKTIAAIADSQMKKIAAMANVQIKTIAAIADVQMERIADAQMNTVDTQITISNAQKTATLDSQKTATFDTQKILDDALSTVHTLSTVDANMMGTNAQSKIPSNNIQRKSVKRTWVQTQLSFPLKHQTR